MNAPWVTYKDWGSDMLYIQIFGQDNIIINSEKIARDLLEHRSQNYSDRPEMPNNEIFGLDYITVFVGYNSRWRLHRKILQQSFRQHAALGFRPMQEAKAHELLLNLLEDPVNYPKHLETSPPPILAAWHESQETRAFIQEIVSRPLGHSIYVYAMRSQLDEGDSDLVWQKKVVQESAATACVAGTETVGMK
ncbi:hypothetical protein AZE42_13370 [Rhizopogon vesiculosus]|uniref:Cytochrome P450 n=1 Tax=Rhizopogon vesiculosus TaxID=180088 RepID=A0A1J8Q6L5_9AGAM|nr:hypothetical protein AZE42_13370 [Rhizopogon vesiculosus]